MTTAKEMRDLTIDVQRNSDELGAAMRDLNAWERQMKAKDEQLIAAHRASQADSSANVPEKRRLVSAAQKYSSFDVEAAISSKSVSKSVSKEEAASLKEKGNAYFTKGKYLEAIKMYTEAIALDPQNPALFANRAMAHIKLEHFDEAEPDCSIALDLDHDYIKALQRRALSREKLDKYRLALEDCRRVLQLEPQNVQALAQLQRIEKRKQGATTTRKTSQTVGKTSNSLKENLGGVFANPHVFIDSKEESKELELGQVLPIHKEPSQRSKKPLIRIQIQDLEASS